MSRRVFTAYCPAYSRTTAISCVSRLIKSEEEWEEAKPNKAAIKRCRMITILTIVQLPTLCPTAAGPERHHCKAISAR